MRVCSRWIGSFEAFFEDMGEAPPGKSLDRINNDGSYEPGNCRWLDAKGQARNRSNGIAIEAFGRRRLLVEWAEETGLPYQALYRRMANGWAPERALTEPLHRRRSRE